VYLRVWGDHFTPPCCAVWSYSLSVSVCIWGDGLGVCFYLLSISCNISNIGLRVSMYVSFICNLFLLILCMWYRSNVFICYTFLSVFMTSIVSVIFPYVYLVFSMWFEYPEFPLLLLIACICSLYLVWNTRPVCPMCFSGQYMPLLFSHSFQYMYYFFLITFINFWISFRYVGYYVYSVNTIKY
jgi:hypothetical protein